MMGKALFTLKKTCALALEPGIATARRKAANAKTNDASAS
jgi:hypothetical protein